jgi:hypothetical protein
VGPLSIRGDRFNYNEAATQSSSEQLLLNLVRLRYGEPIYFMEIGSVLSQYTLEFNASTSYWSNDLNIWQSPALRSQYNVDGDASRQRTYGANAGYSDRPTITYKPLTGEEFAQRVMAPIKPETIIYLSQSGWNVDRIMDLCVQQVNGIQNIPIHKPHEQGIIDVMPYHRLGDLLSRIQDAGQLNFSVELDQYNRQVLYLYPPTQVATVEEDLKELSRLLGVPDPSKKIIVIAGPVRRTPNEIAMQTRSLLGTMFALAQSIQPPEEHIESGQIGWDIESYLVPPEEELEGPAFSERWVTVEHSKLPALDAFVQVFYNGYWFYIRKSDWSSKRSFALLTYLFNLQAQTTGKEGLPVVTVPTG